MSKGKKGKAGKRAPVGPSAAQLLPEIEAVCNDQETWAVDPLRCLATLHEKLDALIAAQAAAAACSVGKAAAGDGASEEEEVAGGPGSSLPKGDGHGNAATTEAMERFWAWVTRTAGPELRSRVAIGWVGEGMGNGVLAAADVAAGEVLMRVPANLMLCLPNGAGPMAGSARLASSPIPGLVAGHPLLASTPTLGLALLLLHERLKVVASAHKGSVVPKLSALADACLVFSKLKSVFCVVDHVSTLAGNVVVLRSLPGSPPDRLRCAALLGHRGAQRSLLRGPGCLCKGAIIRPLQHVLQPPAHCVQTSTVIVCVLLQAAGGIRMAAKQYVVLHHLSTAADPAGFGKHLPVVAEGVPGLTFARFRWALAATITRQNEVPLSAFGQAAGACLALIPVWDMCNHAPAGGTETALVQAGGDAALECAALRAHGVGDEVRIFYGPRPSSELLLYSGFVPAPGTNIHDKSVLSWGLAASGASDSADADADADPNALAGSCASSGEVAGLIAARALLCRKLAIPVRDTLAGGKALSAMLSTQAVAAASSAASPEEASVEGEGGRLGLRLALLASVCPRPAALAWMRSGPDAAAFADQPGSAEESAVESAEESSTLASALAPGGAALLRRVLRHKASKLDAAAATAQAAVAAASEDNATIRRLGLVRALVTAEAALLRAADASADGFLAARRDP